MIPEAAVEALARVLAEEALFDADCSGSGWDAETDSSDHFMPRARTRALEYLEAAAPHMLSHEREETRLAHLDAVVNAETVDRLEKELAEAEDDCCCGNCGL